MPARRSTPTPTRRRLLAGVAASLATLAGCLDAGPGRTGERSPTHTPSGTDDPEYHTHGASYLELAAHAADLEAAWALEYDDLSATGRRVVDDALGDGTGSYESWEGPLLPERAHVEREGRYYAVEETETGQRRVDGHQVELKTLTVGGEPGDWTTPATVTEARERATDFENLSAPDRHVVREGVGDEFRGETGFESTYPVAVEDEANATLLDGDVHYVRYEGELLAVQRTESQELVAVTYEYDLREVAADADAFIEHVRSEHVLDLDAADLSAGERELFEAAIGGTVEREGPFSEATESLLERLRNHEGNPLDDAVYVVYGGEVYRVEVALAVP